MDRPEFTNLVQEWRQLRQETCFMAQDMTHGKDLTVPRIDHNKLMRRHEIAQLLVLELNNSDLSPTEKYEIRDDV